MLRPLLVTGALVLLAACGDGQPLNFGTDEQEPPPVDPDPEAPPTPAEQTQGNVADAVYDPANDTLRVDIASLDGTPLLVDYRRDATLDIGAYQAYRQQDDPLDRLFLGYARRLDGVEGVLAMDGGQFSTYYGGVQSSQRGDYTAPTNGLVSYAGDYVGMLNADIPDGAASDRRLPVPEGTPLTRVPGQSVRIDGDAFFNADFTNDVVNGVIDNRIVADRNVTVAGQRRLAPVFLVQGDIAEDGSFGGAARLDPETGVGAFSGVFGGNRAAGMAGGVFLDGDFIQDADGENEYGLFVLRQCGLSGDDRRCTGTNP